MNVERMIRFLAGFAMLIVHGTKGGTVNNAYIKSCADAAHELWRQS